MIDIKLGETYEVSELRMGGYSPVEVCGFKDLLLIERYGANEYIKYRRGTENVLVVKNSGLLKVIARFDPEKMKKTEIFRGKK